MKIALVNTWDVMGGAAGLAVRITQRLREQGHEAVLIVGRKTRKEDWIIEVPVFGDGTVLEKAGRFLGGKLAKKPSDSPEARHAWRRVVQNLNLSSRLAARQGYEDFSYPGSRDVWDRIGFVPDVVHLHNLHAFNGNTHFDLRILPWISARSKVVFTLHDAWLLTGHCGHFFQCQRWKTGCGACPDLVTYPPIKKDKTSENWRRRAELYQKSHYIVTGPCRWIVNEAKLSPLGRGMTDSRVIPNGIDLNWFSPRSDTAAIRESLGVPEGFRVLCFVSEHGKINPYRDFSFVERMLKHYPKEAAGRGLAVLEVGGQVYQRKESEGLTWIGTGLIRDRARMRDVLAASDILVHPAVADTFPTVVLEAMACGTPVMSTPVCGIVDQITDGENGLLVSLAEPAVAAQRVRTLLQDDAAMKAMKVAARQRAEREYGEERMMKGYEDLYAEMVGG